MKIFTLAILYFLVSFVTVAQTNVTGKIIDREDNELEGLYERWEELTNLA